MSNKQEQTKWWKQKKVLVSAVVAVVLIGAGVTAWWLTNNLVTTNEPTASDEKRAKAEADAKQAEADGELRDQALAAIKGDKAADADKLYDQAVETEKSTERKTLLYLDLSATYYKEGRYAEAFAAAEKAGAANPDKFLVADWLSRLYEDQKNYTKAAEYYTLAGESATSVQNRTAMKKAYYDSKAAEMKKLAQGGKQ